MREKLILNLLCLIPAKHKFLSLFSDRSGEMGWGQGTVLRSEVNSTHIMRRLTIGNRKQKGGIIET